MQDRKQGGMRPHRLRWTLAGVALVVLYLVVPIRSEPDAAVLILRWGATAVLLGAVAVAIRWQAVRQIREPDAPLGAMVVGLLAGLLVFALVDYAVSVYRPGEFTGMDTRVDALYFALSTLLTVGYGDVSAQGQVARALLCIQMAFNVTVIAGSASLIAQKFAQRAGARRRRS